MKSILLTAISLVALCQGAYAADERDGRLPQKPISKFSSALSEQLKNQKKPPVPESRSLPNGEQSRQALLGDQISQSYALGAVASFDSASWQDQILIGSMVKGPSPLKKSTFGPEVDESELKRQTAKGTAQTQILQSGPTFDISALLNQDVGSVVNASFLIFPLEEEAPRDEEFDESEAQDENANAQAQVPPSDSKCLLSHSPSGEGQFLF